MKKCITCKLMLPLTSFYKCGKYFISYCKDCHKKTTAKPKKYNRHVIEYKRFIKSNLRNTKYVDKRREADKKYQRKRRFLNKEKKLKEVKEYKIKYPEKAKAHNMVNNAIRKRVLVKEKCRDCDRLDVHGHHPDYSKPLEVVWLCPVHHKLEHLKLKSQV